MSPRSTKTLVAAVAALGLLYWVAAPGSDPAAPAAPREVAAAEPAVTDFKVTGPFTHANLTVFLLHGPDTLPPRPIVTLDEALARGAFVVHETGEVNTLAVENMSDDDVLIQSGDMVKGGRQDRVLSTAMLVPANSGRIPVPSFCVERGRWSGRGGEAAGRFAECNAVLAGKDLKYAANVAGQQSAVWENVQKLQEKLTENVGEKVNSAQSETSLQLALENRKVNDALVAYERTLGSALRGAKGVVGFVVAVNGKVTGAEVYGSAAVMAKAWPRALRSAAVEALSERNAATGCEPPTCEAAMAFLADAAKGQAEEVAGRGTAAGLAMAPAMMGDGEVDHRAMGWNPAGGQLGAVVANPEPAPVRQQEGRQVNRSLLRVGGGNNDRPAAPVAVNRRTGSQAVQVESRDQANPSVVIHRSYIAK